MKQTAIAAQDSADKAGVRQKVQSLNPATGEQLAEFEPRQTRRLKRR